MTSPAEADSAYARAEAVEPKSHADEALVWRALALLPAGDSAAFNIFDLAVAEVRGDPRAVAELLVPCYIRTPFDFHDDTDFTPALRRSPEVRRVLARL